MRVGRAWPRWILILEVAILVGLLAACRRPAREDPLPPTPHPGPSFPAGTTMETIQSAGVLRVGITSDQIGFGFTNSVTGQIEGFDREIAQLVAQAIFGIRELEGAFHRIAFKPFKSNDGDRLLSDGEADIVLTTVAPQQDVLQTFDFVGPYLLASRDLAVRSVPGPSTAAGLVGKKVCSANDPPPRRQQLHPQQFDVVADTAAACADALKSGRVVGMSANTAILNRLVDDSSGILRILPDGRTQESHVIGVKKGDAAFKVFLNERLAELFQNGVWGAAFDRTLGTLGLPRPEPPAITAISHNGSGGTLTNGTTKAGSTTTARR